MKRLSAFLVAGGIAVGLLLATWHRPGRNSAANFDTSVEGKGPVELNTSPASTLNGKAVQATNLAPLAEPDLPKPQLLRSIVTNIEGVQSTTDPLLKEDKLNRAAAEVAIADLPAVVDFLWHKQHLSPTGTELLSRVLKRWVETDPNQAAVWAASQPESEFKSVALHQIASAWACLDVGAATAWVKQLPDVDLQHEALAQVAYEAARSVPLEAMKLAVELPPGPTRDDLLAHVAGTWAASEPQSAADWVMQVQDPTLRDRLLVSVAATWANDAPQEAVQLALQALPAGRQQDDAVVSVVQGWAQQQPQDVAAWVLQFPEVELRDVALENLVSIWADQDLVQAQAWLAGLQAGAARDVAIGAIVAKVLAQSPAGAASLAGQVSDATRRQRELENVGMLWLQTDDDAARAWIASAPLAAEAKARLLASNEVTAVANP